MRLRLSLLGSLPHSTADADHRRRVLTLRVEVAEDVLARLIELPDRLLESLHLLLAGGVLGEGTLGLGLRRCDVKLVGQPLRVQGALTGFAQLPFELLPRWLPGILGSAHSGKSLYPPYKRGILLPIM